MVRHLEVIEYLLIETVVTIQQGLHFAEEHAGFGALNDAVIVGASEHHHLADAEHGAGLIRRTLILAG